MDINNLTPLIDLCAPLLLIGIGWLSYSQAHTSTDRRAGMICVLTSLLFLAIALSNPGVVLSIVFSLLGGVGLGLLKWGGEIRRKVAIDEWGPYWHKWSPTDLVNTKSLFYHLADR